MTALLCSYTSGNIYPEHYKHIDRIHKNNNEMFDTFELTRSMEDLSISWERKTRTFSYSFQPLKKTQLRSILKKSLSVDSLHKFKLPALKIESLSSSKEIDTIVSEDKQQFVPNIEPPPRSPTKVVSFADDNNLKLVEVKNFVPSSERINLWSSSESFPSATQTFQTSKAEREDGYYDHSIQKPSKKLDKTELKLCFVEPYIDHGFLQRFKHRCVSLEKCGIRGRSIIGVVVVKNIEYSKQVSIRYTLDQWKTYSDTGGCYVTNSNDIDTDRFSFTLVLPKDCQSIEFAVCYKTSTSEFWDNNYNRNYKVIQAQR